MPDISEVLSGLASAAVAAVYPQGTGQPSVTGAAVKVYPGEPNAADLDVSLRANVAHVGVRLRPGIMARAGDVPLADADVLSVPAPTVTAAVVGSAVTFSGTVTAGWPVAVLVDRVLYSYRPSPGDTLAAVVAALAAQISAQRAASALGAVLTVPGAILSPRFSSMATTRQPLRRQVQGVLVTVYANSPAQRDTIAAAIDAAFAAATRIDFADGTRGTIRYAGVAYDDPGQKAGLLRRIQSYTVEYTTTLTASAPTAIGIVVDVETAGTVGQVPVRTPMVNVFVDDDGNPVVDANLTLTGTP